ncbi:hypothetical protein [Campylobacter ureolyticus]|uniref:hypothetical protein n=1 Tax=Campylobacter ureolyticus TaxID=827 RepID=UPI0022B4A3DF|nr:hypothetical protein [Campylobacter ureolyticus]MCZ6117184.1 hypothetical protein [Campylobacter ureolyticus]
MSDDKREKLREYLRNNRPKNKMNLGNNSDTKENSNKNLKNESNLDNPQISSNKTKSNKRDYDKEPLILKDYTNSMEAHNIFNVMLCFVSSFICLGTCETYVDIFKTSFLLFCIYSIFFIIDISILNFLSNSKKLVKLGQTKILFYENSKLVREFIVKTKPKKYAIDDIDKIEFDSFLYAIKMYGKRIGLPILLFAIVFAIIKSDKEIFLTIISIFFILVLTIFYDVLVRMFLYRKSNGNLENFLKYSQKLQIDIGWIRNIRIVTRKGISLFYFNEEDYKKIKEYISIVYDKNLDKDVKPISSY